MENQTPVQAPIVPIAPVITPPPTPIVAASMPKKFNFNINDLKSKIPNIPKNIKILIISIIILIVLLIVLVFSGVASRVKNKILPTPTPIATATPSLPEITNPSAYANDPEVLNLEQKLTDFDKNVSSLELKEDTIRPPSVDWDVSFN